MKPITLNKLRPRESGQKLTAQLTIRLNPAMLDQLLIAAAHEQINTSSMARRCLAIALAHWLAGPETRPDHDDPANSNRRQPNGRL